MCIRKRLQRLFSVYLLKPYPVEVIKKVPHPIYVDRPIPQPYPVHVKVAVPKVSEL